MPALRLRGALSLIAVAAVVAACGDSTGPKTPHAQILTAYAGNGQTGTVGAPLASPLVVRVTDSTSRPVAGVTVTFQVTSGSGTVNPTTAQTDTGGRAQTELTLGQNAGQVEVTASVQGTSLTVKFALNALAPCSGSTALDLGQTVPLSTSSVCVGGGASGADYMLVAFNGTQNNANSFTVNVTGNNVVAPSGPLADLQFAAAPRLSRSMAVTPLPGAFGVSAPGNVGAAFDRMLRLRERSALTPLIPGARAWWARQSAATSPLLRRTITTPSNAAVGDTVVLNASLDPCTTTLNIQARVAAITAKSIVVADVNNPDGGFTDAEYAAVGTTFDTLVDRVDTAAFGQPTDIDKNGKVLLFFTKEVNKLTPANSRGYVGGFFYGRDLFPRTDTTGIRGCPTSNLAEMFYLLVPDPNGTINSNVRTKAMVQQVTIGTTAHEFQHLINTGRRLYVNDALDFEEQWLDEGLAHIAEELLFYREAGLTPKQNIGRSTLNNTQRVDAFNNYQSSNFGRFETYLESPSAYGPYQPNDSLETRGATWAMLRYLADQSGLTDSVVWHRLVADAKESGLANLAQAFRGSAGDVSGMVDLIRNWSVSVGTDDLSAGVPSLYQMPSWNYRSLFACLLETTQGACDGNYPLVLQTLPNASQQSTSLVASGSVYYRFRVASGQQATINWASTASNQNDLKVTVVRTK